MKILRFVLLLWAVSWGSASAQDALSTGLNFLDDAQYRSIPLASTPLLGNIPDEVDLSDKFPRPGSQGKQASCVGWAISNLKAYQERVERGWALDTHRFSPAYIYNQIRGTSSSCLVGSNFVEALNVLRNGHALLSDFPYDENDCNSLPDAGVKQKARAFAIADWRRVNVQDEVEVKTQIASGFPVLIGMMVDDGFGALSGDRVYTAPSGNPRGGHAMVVVGYSDDRRAFKLINSWGTRWGNGGFGWVDYAVFRRVVREAYVAQDVVINNPAPVHRPIEPDQPSPPQPPAPSIDVKLNTPQIVHNVPVQTANGPFPGMQIRVPGRITGASGRSLQIVVRFNYLNGPALRSHPMETVFRDAGGLVTAATQPIPVATDSEAIDALQVMIPYYALNFQPTGGAATLNLSLTAIALVDNIQRSQTPPEGFMLRW